MLRMLALSAALWVIAGELDAQETAPDGPRATTPETRDEEKVIPLDTTGMHVPPGFDEFVRFFATVVRAEAGESVELVAALDTVSGDLERLLALNELERPEQLAALAEIRVPITVMSLQFDSTLGRRDDGRQERRRGSSSECAAR